MSAGDPEVRILGHGKDKTRNTLSRRTARASGADGLGSRDRIREQIGGYIVDLSEGWLQQGQLAHPLTGRALHSNVPRGWVKQHETDTGQRDGATSAERDRIKELERENRQLRQANEILKKASAYFAQAELDRPFRK